jgi:hypothetical protein
VAIGRIETEDDLRAFIQQTLRGSDQSTLIRQAQGGALLFPKYLSAVPAGKRLVFNIVATAAPFVGGGSVTSTMATPHGLGVVPSWCVVMPWFEDSGYWLPCKVSIDATNMSWSARDAQGLAHGPGNLSGQAMLAIGIK